MNFENVTTLGRHGKEIRISVAGNRRLQLRQVRSGEFGQLPVQRSIERRPIPRSDHNYVGMIERGERNPAVFNVVKIAKALGVPPSELFREFK